MKFKSIREQVNAALAAKTDAEAVRILNADKPKPRPITLCEIMRKHIYAAGVPNGKFYKALRAAKALDAMLDKPMPPIEGTNYKVTLANGKDVTLFVPKGADIFKLAKDEGLEMVSFCKVN